MRVIGKVGFEALKVECVIGHLEEERTYTQPLYIDLQLETDFSNAAQSDDFTGTIDYVQAANICSDVAITGQFRLLEALAHETLQQLFSKLPIVYARIRICKPSALPAAQWAVVELERSATGGTR